MQRGPSEASLASRVYQASHLTGTFVLRSGRTSGEYFDKYLFEGDPALLRDVSAALAGLIPDGADAVAGLELGGIPLATVISQMTGMPTLFVRKEAKRYGTRRLAEGGAVGGRRLVVVEDIVTSGGQVLKSCADPPNPALGPGRVSPAAFPSADRLPSTTSAPARAGLFDSFAGTTRSSDFRPSSIKGLPPKRSPHGPPQATLRHWRATTGPPGSRA